MSERRQFEIELARLVVVVGGALLVTLGAIGAAAVDIDAGIAGLSLIEAVKSASARSWSPLGP
jgi:hypothetical protein